MKHINTALIKTLSFLVIALLVGGCAAFPSDISDVNAVVEIPPSAEQSPDAPIGDIRENSFSRATLYYSSVINSRIMPLTRILWPPTNQTAEERLTEEMLKSPGTPDVASIFPDGTRLMFVESSMGTATINLSPATDDMQISTDMLTGLSSTLTQLDNVVCVNVLISGRALSLAGMPLGAVSISGGDTKSFSSMIADDSARLSGAGDSETRITRAATLYYPSEYDNYLVPETRNIQISSIDAATKLISALAETPQTAGVISGVPISDNALIKPCDITVSDNGERLQNVYFSPNLVNLLDVGALSRYDFLASVTLTLCTFCPDIDGVRVYIGESYALTEVNDSYGNILRFPSGVMRREHFAGSIGALVKIRFADSNGQLKGEYRALSLTDSRSPRARIELLMQSPKSSELYKTFPDGLADSDVLGTYIGENEARVNFSGEFYGLCQTLDFEEESRLVYSLVNTLSEFESVKRVRIYIDGSPADTLSGGINLRGALLPNPGMNVND